MIETISYAVMLLSLLTLSFFSYRYFYFKSKHARLINAIFSLDDKEIISEDASAKRAAFELKLTQAGITKKEYTEVIFASLLASASLLFLIWYLDLGTVFNAFIALIAIFIAFFMPKLYLEEQIKARIKRIENDLAIFIDLLIIILEGGGGLNNAIDKVTTEATDVLGKDLIEESKKFKNEFTTYSSDVAYTNLAKRTASDAIATIVGFMRLSEETGIGVKSIFENQAQEIKAMEMLNIEKKAATMNISITFVMFLFILPAVIAMIAFPVAADALMPGF
jgi:tight adherence protein C